MKTTSFQPTNINTGMHPISFRQEARGEMLCRLERLRQLANESLKKGERRPYGKTKTPFLPTVNSNQ